MTLSDLNFAVKEQITSWPKASVTSHTDDSEPSSSYRAFQYH